MSMAVSIGSARKCPAVITLQLYVWFIRFNFWLAALDIVYYRYFQLVFDNHAFNILSAPDTKVHLHDQLFLIFFIEEKKEEEGEKTDEAKKEEEGKTEEKKEEEKKEEEKKEEEKKEEDDLKKEKIEVPEKDESKPEEENKEEKKE